MPGMRSGPTASRSSSRRAQREALVDHALHSLPCPAAPLSPAPLLGARSPFETVARAASGRTASVAIALRGDKLYSDETIELARGERTEPGSCCGRGKRHGPTSVRCRAAASWHAD